MMVIPAVDLRGGRAVRLVQGDAARVRDYGDPVAWARRWVSAGARWLHVVDLDGALQGRPRHLDLLARLCGLGAAVQVGGGFRTAEDVAAALAAGASRVVVGTAADAGLDVSRFGEAVVVALDARGRRVAVRGWTEQTSWDVVEAARRLRARGAARFLYTDIGRDGTLAGPNVEVLAEVVRAAGAPVIAAGGIAAVEHLEAVEQAGAEAAVVGRALYEGRLDLGALVQRWREPAC